MPRADYRLIVDLEDVGIYSHPGHADVKGWWWMDEASGSLVDSSGQGNNLGAVGAPSYRQSGPKPRYLAVGISSGNRFEIADNASLSITGALTIIGWAYFNALGSLEAIISKWLETGDQRSYRLIKQAANTIRAEISSAGTAASIVAATTSGTPAAGSWVFVAARFTPSSELAVWLDSEKVINTTGIPASIFDSNAKFVLGDQEGPAQAMAGRIGPGGVFSRALSDAEIDAIRQKGPYGDISEYIDLKAPISIDRGRTSPLATFKIGSCSLAVINKDKRFTPENTSSPLYGKLVPRRRMQIKAIYSQIPYYLFSGFSKEIVPIPREGPPAQARLFFEDGLSRLMEVRLRSAMLQNVLTGSAINNLLDEVGWPAGDRQVDAGLLTIQYMAWDDIPAAQALMEIASAEGGQIYIGADGKVIFEDRHHRAKPPHNSPLATINNTMETLHYRMDPELIRNRIDIQIYPRKLGSTDVVISELQEAQKISKGQQIKLFLQYRDPTTLRPAEAINVTTPVSGTDYLAYENKNGTGDDLISQLTVTFTNHGRSGEWAITNNSNKKVWLTKAQVRGQPLTWFDVLLVRAEDAVTISKYVASLVLDSRVREEYEKTKDEADFFLAHLKDPKGVFDLTLSNGKASIFTEALSREISDRMKVINTPQALDEEIFIGGIMHEITDGGRRHRTTWLGERFGIDGQAFIVGTSTVGGPDKIWY